MLVVTTRPVLSMAVDRSFLYWLQRKEALLSLFWLPVTGGPVQHASIMQDASDNPTILLASYSSFSSSFSVPSTSSTIHTMEITKALQYEEEGQTQSMETTKALQDEEEAQTQKLETTKALQNEEAQTHSNGVVIFMVVAFFIILPPLLVFSIRRMR